MSDCEKKCREFRPEQKPADSEETLKKFSESKTRAKTVAKTLRNPSGKGAIKIKLSTRVLPVVNTGKCRMDGVECEEINPSEQLDEDIAEQETAVLKSARGDCEILRATRLIGEQRVSTEKRLKDQKYSELARKGKHLTTIARTDANVQTSESDATTVVNSTREEYKLCEEKDVLVTSCCLEDTDVKDEITKLEKPERDEEILTETVTDDQSKFIHIVKNPRTLSGVRKTVDDCSVKEGTHFNGTDKEGNDNTKTRESIDKHHHSGNGLGKCVSNLGDGTRQGIKMERKQGKDLLCSEHGVLISRCETGEDSQVDDESIPNNEDIVAKNELSSVQRQSYPDKIYQCKEFGVNDLKTCKDSLVKESKQSETDSEVQNITRDRSDSSDKNIMRKVAEHKETEPSELCNEKEEATNLDESRLGKRDQQDIVESRTNNSVSEHVGGGETDDQNCELVLRKVLKNERDIIRNLSPEFDLNNGVEQGNFNTDDLLQENCKQNTLISCETEQCCEVETNQSHVMSRKAVNSKETLEGDLVLGIAKSRQFGEEMCLHEEARVEIVEEVLKENKLDVVDKAPDEQSARKVQQENKLENLKLEKYICGEQLASEIRDGPVCKHVSGNENREENNTKDVSEINENGKRNRHSVMKGKDTISEKQTFIEIDDETGKTKGHTGDGGKINENRTDVGCEIKTVRKPEEKENLSSSESSSEDKKETWQQRKLDFLADDLTTNGGIENELPGWEITPLLSDDEMTEFEYIDGPEVHTIELESIEIEDDLVGELPQVKMRKRSRGRLPRAGGDPLVRKRAATQSCIMGSIDTNGSLLAKNDGKLPGELEHTDTRPKYYSLPPELLLHSAVMENDADSLTDLLVKLKLNVNQSFYEGITPLHEAASVGHIECAQVLINHGANLSTQTSQGLTPLEAAVFTGNFECAELLIRSGASVDTIKDGFIDPGISTKTK